MSQAGSVALVAAMRRFTAAPEDVRLAALVARLVERFGDNLRGVLLYGSCRRSGNFGDGLVDLYAVVARRLDVEGILTAALGCWLPPNVYYVVADSAAGPVRAKCGLFSEADLRRGTGAAFHSYVWARLAQPMALVYAADGQAEAALRALLAQAVLTFVRRARGLVAPGAPVVDMWAAGLRACYAAELRVERTGRADAIIASDPDYYTVVGAAALAAVGAAPGDRALVWRVRATQGKLLSLVRLAKGLATFDGAIDYIVWKLERHSGQSIDVPERVRRWPWLFVWAFAWRLYRAGVFR